MDLFGQLQALRRLLRRRDGDAMEEEDEEDAREGQGGERKEGEGEGEGTAPDTSCVEGHDILADIRRATDGPVTDLSRDLLRRQTAAGRVKPSRRTCHLAQHFTPNHCEALVPLDSRVFCCKWSRDGERLMTASQDAVVRFYGAHSTKELRQIRCRDVGWSVVDTDMSPDSRFAIYSTWSPYVSLCNVYGDYELHEQLDFEPVAGRCCFFSVEFSPDSREILAGSNEGALYLYDVERRERVVQLAAHADDVNSVCWGDESANLLVSGSDDGLVKVWDRREVGAACIERERLATPSGVLRGHYEGITCVAAKGDGRYLCSNSKDQSLKLWDMRAMADGHDQRPARRVSPRWDYRIGFVTDAMTRVWARKQEGDSSLMTYRGHRVFQTLVRCGFSPLHTTGQQFIYTGSQSGACVIYDLATGRVAKKLLAHHGTVRDVAWHPHLPLIATAAWDGAVGRWAYHKL